jgi:hypothetical protein
VEFLFQSFEFGKAGFHSLIGDHQKPENPPLVLFPPPVFQKPGDERNH